MDCSGQRKLIKVIDDQDKCEWVNVSSGTGSSGQSQTKGRKTVVVLVVIIAQLLSLFLPQACVQCQFGVK